MDCMFFSPIAGLWRSVVLYRLSDYPLIMELQTLNQILQIRQCRLKDISGLRPYVHANMQRPEIAPTFTGSQLSNGH